MRNRPLLAAAIALASVIAGVSSAAPSAAQTPSATLTVDPATDLVDGQSVRYDGAGYAAGQSLMIMQCTPGATSMTEVFAKCELRQSAGADATGSFSGFVSVKSSFRPMGGSETVDCTAAPGACAISTFDMVTTVVDAPISFADPTVPRPEVSVAPAVDLEDGDVVAVTGTGFPADTSVTVAQCLSDRPATAEWCDDGSPVEVSTDAAGAFAVELTIHRGVTTQSGTVIDCAADGGTPCAVAAFTGDGAAWDNSPIDLIYRRVLAMASSPLVVSPQGKVELTGLVYCSVPTSRVVTVSGVIRQTLEDRVLTEEFSATTSCPTVFGGTWSTQVGGSRTQRFKVGTASITAWAVEANDPLPDDAESLSSEVQLVRSLP